MRRENAHLDLDSANVSTGATTPDVEVEDSPVPIEDGIDSGLDDEITEDPPQPSDDFPASHPKAQNNGKINSSDDEDTDDDDGNPTEASDARHIPKSNETDEDDDEDDDYAPMDEVQARLAGATLDGDSPTATPSEGNAPETAAPVKTLGKAAQKRAKKAAAAAAAATNSESDASTAHQCAVCNAGFPSKTQLFQHIKKNGHAAPVSTIKGSASKKTKSKRG